MNDQDKQQLDRRNRMGKIGFTVGGAFAGLLLWGGTQGKADGFFAFTAFGGLVSYWIIDMREELTKTRARVEELERREKEQKR